MASDKTFTEFIAGIVTKTTLVGDADPHMRWKPTIVHVDDELLEVVKKFISLYEVRTVAVIDEDERLVGVIRETSVADDVFLHLMPAEFLAGVLGASGMAELATRTGARVAKDLMQAPVSVKAGETLKEAFAKMHRNRLYGLPIVDDGMRVIGYLDMQQILAVWLKALGQEESPETSG